jgi:hypothetical protein
MQKTINKFIFKKVLVNLFIADGDFQILLHPTTYLLQTPLFAKQLFYICPDTAIYTRVNFSLVSFFCKCISMIGVITPMWSKFSTYCRFENANYFRNLQLYKSYFKHRIYSVSLFQRELALVFQWCSSL